MTNTDNTEERDTGQGHTPGLLRRAPTSARSKQVSETNIESQNERFICSTGGYQDGREETHDENRANACRIVACVNACEGIPTEALEDGVVKDMLEALRALMDLNDNGGPFGGEIYQDRVDRAWNNARAAIAKATGGAA